MVNWKSIPLGQIAEFRNGVNYDSTSFGKGIKVINVSDFKDRMYPDYKSLSELDSSSKWHDESFLKAGDIIFVRSNGNKNLIGRSLYIKNLPENFKVTFSAFCIRLRFLDNLEIEPYFYLYVFKSPLFRALLSQFGNGANINNLNQDILKNIKIPIPNLLMQKKIATILADYDDLIENNIKRIQLLEEMAEEIYKEWFVRLRFPDYEKVVFLDKNGKKVDRETDGALPQGWRCGEIQDFFKTSSGGTPSRKKPEFYKNGKHNWLKTKELLGSFIFSTEEQITDEAIKNSSAKIFPSETVLMGMYGGVHGEGRKSTLGQVGILSEPSCTNQACCAFLPINIKSYSYPFVFLFLKFKQSAFLNMSMGAAQQNISQDIIKNSSYIQPDINVLEVFDKIVKPLFEEIKVLLQKNQVLQETRNLLLPRLISGKLSVAHLLEKDKLSISTEPIHSMAAEPEAIYNIKNH